MLVSVRMPVMMRVDVMRRLSGLAWAIGFSVDHHVDLCRCDSATVYLRDLQLGPGRNNSRTLAEGQVWFWELPVRHINLASFDASAHLDGDVKLAVGAQYDYETLKAFNINGPLGQRGGTAVPGGLVVAANVARSVDSVFGEVSVPIVVTSVL